MPKDIIITGISGYKIVKTEDYGDLRLYVHFEGEVCCHKCGSLSLRKKDSFWRRLKHVSIGMRRTELIVKSHKYKCLDCGKYFNLRLPGVAPRRRATELFRREVFERHHHGHSQKYLSKSLKLGHATVERWYQEITKLKAGHFVNAASPRVLGIDEHFFTRKKGYATTLADLSKRKVYDVVLGRSEKSLESYLRKLQNKENTKVILMDLSETYRSIAKKHFPHAKIVADRFHVVRLVNQRFLETWKLLDETGRKNRGLLSLMRRHEEKLRPEQKENLYKYFKTVPGLKEIYEFKQSLMRLLLKKKQNQFKCKKLVKQYLWHIEHLRDSKIKPLEQLGKTLYRWREEIVRMFRFSKTNSITEGLHNKMEMISRRAFGFRNFNNYRVRVLVHCS